MPRLRLAGFEVPVADSFRVRFLGLAHLDRCAAGPGLVIPDCNSVHTFGMRFELDLWFLAGDGRPLRVCRRVPPRRLLWCRAATEVLEIVPGGECAGPEA